MLLPWELEEGTPRSRSNIEATVMAPRGVVCGCAEDKAGLGEANSPVCPVLGAAAAAG